MSATIVKPSTLDKSLVNFGEPQPNSHGGKSLKIGYSDEAKFLIHAPPMYIPWDMTREEIKSDNPTASKDGSKPQNNVKYSFQLSFRGIDGDDLNAKRLKSFHTMLEEIDSLLVDTASANSLTWLKMKSAPKPVVEALLNPTIKVSKDTVSQEPDGKYPDSIKVRIPYYSKDDRFGCSFFDKDNKHITDMNVLSKLRRGTLVACILECGGVYFSNGKFGTTWSLYQCVIKSESMNKVPKGICLITDSDDDMDTNDLTASEVEKPASNQLRFSSQIIHDDENDELDENIPTKSTDSVKPVATSEPSTTKRVIRKPAAATTKK
jgi:hypothetical protein